MPLTSKYKYRSRAQVEAVQVTPHNLQKVADWCGGYVLTVLGAVAFRKKPTDHGYGGVAQPGHYIVREQGSHRLMTADTFHNTFY